ncbi:hypothetical protein SLEP1_g37340 [Rubroshorea leprosula]|uniref:U-box domain-containing protein n=1 Tax=Rubroshorea leprosula TaxID=152421 RepID=A0AAV5KUL1_9ROSI|nr:hypothetical protein SLEP1_g37340 [Rubroshorea leprosula]
MDSGGLVLKASSGFLPSGTLLEPLIQISHEVASMEKLPFIQDGSALWGIILTEVISNQFYVLVKEMRMALDILPLSLLNILTTDIREQVELFHKQAKRADLFVDPKELQRRGELPESPLDHEEEIRKLEAEAQQLAGTGGMRRPEETSVRGHLPAYDDRSIDHSSSSQSMLQNIPDEFRCPLSLDLKRILGQKLIHMALVPNYALKSLVHQWCQEGSSSSASPLERSNNQRETRESAIDHISAAKAAIDAVKMTAEFLVGKLAMGSPEIQRQAAYELRLLAKTGMNHRRIIAEAGAIPFLVTLLSSSDPRIQENAVTALLNLSIFNNNKILIMAAGAIDSIVEVLQSGGTMEARENAASAIFSLSMIDDHKVVIGAHPRAIPALVRLLQEGPAAGIRDAATAMFNLARYNANKACIVLAGAVPLLIEQLMDGKAGITDDALTLMALLIGCPEGLEAIKKSRVLVPLLIGLLRFGSAKGKENSITLLLGLCKDGGRELQVDY